MPKRTLPRDEVEPFRCHLGPTRTVNFMMTSDFSKLYTASWYCHCPASGSIGQLSRIGQGWIPAQLHSVVITMSQKSWPLKSPAEAVVPHPPGEPAALLGELYQPEVPLTRM